MLLTDVCAFASELLLYLALAAPLFARSGALLPDAVFLTAVLASETLCRLLEKKKRLFRCLPLLLFAPLFLFAPSPAAIVFPLPLLILAALRAWTGALAASRDTLRGLLKYGTAAYFFLLACLSVNRDGAFASASLPYFTVFLPVCVLALRLLRAEDAPGKKLTLLNAGLLLFAVCAGLFFSSDTGLFLIKEAAGAVYKYAFVPALLLVIALLLVVPFLLYFLIKWLISLLKPEPAEYMPEEFDLGIRDVLKTEDAVLHETPAWLRDAFIGLGVMLLLYIFWQIAKKMIARRNAGTLQKEGFRIAAPADAPRAERVPLSLAPDAVIRRVYARYLRMIGTIPLAVNGTLLSDELNEQAEPLTGDAGELRKLWLKAKYSPGECTAAEARAAAAALRELRKTFRKNRGD